MQSLQKLLTRLDAFQRRHKSTGFSYAVIKKYGEDNGGYQSAIITYYGLLSLFPLLIIFTAVTQLFLKHDPALQQRVSDSVGRYFPVIGNQLQHSIHSPAKTGLALAVSLAITVYGARGGATALQFAASSLWHVPKLEHPPFIKSMLRNLGIIFGCGLGLVGAAVLSGYTNILGHNFGVRILATAISLAILWVTFIVLFKLAIAGNKSVRQVSVGAAIAAVGIQFLQTAGGIILGHQLKGLDNTYGTFALIIGLLFWIYLQAQVILYAIEVDVVRAYTLWPRSLQQPLSEIDKRALSMQVQALTQYKEQSVDVSFSKKSR